MTQTQDLAAPAPSPAGPSPAIVKRKIIPHAAEAREASKRAMALLDITTLPMWGGVADKLEIAREQHGIHTLVLNLCAFPIEHIALLATKLQGIGYRCSGPAHAFVIDWNEPEEEGPNNPVVCEVPQ